MFLVPQKVYNRSMASNTYIQHCAGGTSRRVRRSNPQGRKKGIEPPRVKMSFRARVSTQNRLLAEAEKYSMKPSAYIDLALSAFDIEKYMQLLSDDNCSTQ